MALHVALNHKTHYRYDRRVSLEIYWPSGAVQKMAGIASDQLLQVIEPAAPLSRTSKDHK